MYAIVELDGTVSVVKDGKGLSLEGAGEVRKLIKELEDALFTLHWLKKNLQSSPNLQSI